MNAARPRRRRGVIASTPARILKVAVLLGLLILVPPFVDSPYVTTVFISALLFGLFGAVYDLMIGYAGLANFGYAGFIAAGAYGSALLVPLRHQSLARPADRWGLRCALRFADRYRCACAASILA